MYEFKTLLWHFVTRLGEAQILLPAMLAVAVWMWVRGSAPRLAAAWLGCTALAVATRLLRWWNDRHWSSQGNSQ